MKLTEKDIVPGAFISFLPLGDRGERDFAVIVAVDADRRTFKMRLLVDLRSQEDHPFDTDRYAYNSLLRAVRESMRPLTFQDGVEYMGERDFMLRSRVEMIERDLREAQRRLEEYREERKKLSSLF